MNPPRLEPDRQRYPANRGVKLKLEREGAVMVVANHPIAPMPACRLPRLPASLLDRPARLIRRYAAEDRALIFALYLNVIEKRWTIWLPPQTSVSRLGTTADLTFGTSTSRPRDDFRLAGSLISADSRLWSNVPVLVPKFDGIHLQLGASAWESLSGSLVVEGKTIPSKPRELFSETYDRIDRLLAKNVRA